MKLELFPFQLRFKHAFKIAHGIRITTDVVYVRLSHENMVGWGGATLPPYLPETQETVVDFLKGVDLSAVHVPFNPLMVFKWLNETYPGNYAAKAALDMALWDLKAQMENRTVGQLLGLRVPLMPLCTYTLGVSSFEEMKRKVFEAEEDGFELFKIKLNGINDLESVENLRRLTHKPFAVDVNQGWHTVAEARANIRAILPYEPVLIEQPLPVGDEAGMQQLRKEFLIPFYADESCQTQEQLEELADYFDGVNIKLMKCGGISPAVEMIDRAKELGMSVLIGCMSESSVGCTAAAHLAPLADYVDLDGPYLIANDPFKGMTIEEGRVKVNRLVQLVEM